MRFVYSALKMLFGANHDHRSLGPFSLKNALRIFLVKHYEGKL